MTGHWGDGGDDLLAQRNKAPQRSRSRYNIFSPRPAVRPYGNFQVIEGVNGTTVMRSSIGSRITESGAPADTD